MRFAKAYHLHLGKPQNVTEGLHPAMVAVNAPFNCLAPNPPEKIVAFL